VQTYKTGGGSKSKTLTLNTTCDNMLVNLLGPTITPHENPYDSDGNISVAVVKK
jgi:hypothetical protein